MNTQPSRKSHWWDVHVTYGGLAVGFVVANIVEAIFKAIG